MKKEDIEVIIEDVGLRDVPLELLMIADPEEDAIKSVVLILQE